MSVIRDYFKQSSSVIASLSSEIESIEKIATTIYEASEIGGKVLIAGNGGSCADAEHFAGELLCTFKARDRSPIGAIHLANNSSAITAWTNDFDFNSYFTRQVDSLCWLNLRFIAIVCLFFHLRLLFNN